MRLFFSADRDLELKDTSMQQVKELLDELLRFTDDPQLENEGSLVLYSEQSGLILKRQMPPLLQVLASPYGWFVEYINEVGSATQTMRNSVSEKDLEVAFLGFLENPKRPDNLSWRE